jgi:glucose/arabinose dehydrogenase
MNAARIAAGVLVVLAIGVLVMLPTIRREAVVFLSDDYQDEGSAGVAAVFEGADRKRTRVDVALTPVIDGLFQPTELLFVPGQPDLLVVLQKTGDALWVAADGSARGTLLSIDVVTRSEEGLLGLAFHPQFTTNGRLFLNSTMKSGSKAKTVVQEWRVPAGSDLRTAEATLHHVVLEVEQPYANHNAGQLLFGPDGMLYVPLGDGGFKDDIHGHGQNRSTLLGSILRLDVDAGEPYAVPADNPWVDVEGVRPEAWAYGVRNPWRSTFAPDGRLVVADVGQNAWEEIGFARKGGNLGWNTWEGRHCFPPEQRGCGGDVIPPFYEYPRDEGISVTGGVVYAGTAVPELTGLYVFADFVSGRLWALPLPEGDGPVSGKDVRSLGTWQARFSSFTTAPDGSIWTSDFGRGRLLRLESKP